MVEKRAIYACRVVAQLLNLSEKRVKQLAAEKIIAEYSPGYYKLVPAVQGYVKYLQNQISDDDRMSDYNTEKARLTKTKREDAELDLMVKKRELHKTDEVKFITANMLIAFKSKLEALPYKILPEIMNIADNNSKKDQILDILGSAIHEALSELSGYNPDQYDMDKYLATLDDTIVGEETAEDDTIPDTKTTADDTIISAEEIGEN